MRAPIADRVEPRLLLEADLTPDDDDAIRSLLLAAFPHHAATFRAATWWGARPEARLMLLDGDVVVAHLGLERRAIEVGSEDVAVAGVAAFAVAPSHQRQGLGRRLTIELLRVLLADLPASFAILGCRPAIAPFYAATGWHRLSVTTRALDPESGGWAVTDGPTFVLPAGSGLATWPPGPIDLRGMPW
jgi:predicted N-acetyltransferase YhbS